jgi:hypothetical protein
MQAQSQNILRRSLYPHFYYFFSESSIVCYKRKDLNDLDELDIKGQVFTRQRMVGIYGDARFRDIGY